MSVTPHEMANKVETEVNGATSKSAAARLYEVPVVNDTLSTVHAVIQKTVPAAVYDKSAAVATQVYKATEPIQNRLQPQIQAVDGLANRGLDFVQSRAPYLFETSSDKMMNDATKPANDAAAAARSRFDPVAKQFSAQLESASSSLHSVQDRVASAVASLPRSPQEAHSAASNAASSLLAEIERLRDNVAAQAKELPGQLQTLAHNLFEHLSKGANEIRAEIGRNDVKATERAQNVLRIAQSNAQPVISDTLATVKSLISAGQSKADEATSGAVSDAQTTASSAAEDAKKAVNGAADEAKKQVNGATSNGKSAADSAKETTAQAKGEVKKSGKKAKSAAQDAVKSSS